MRINLKLETVLTELGEYTLYASFLELLEQQDLETLEDLKKETSSHITKLIARKKRG
jgi:hypothetical protein